MADQNVRVQNDSAQRVAFDLMEKISSYDGVDVSKKDRKYFMTLYHQCYKATNGGTLKYIFQED